MAWDTDALNYPYIRIRDVEWLKRTLLVFPHVARIAPSYGSPEDDPEVARFRDLAGRRGPLLRSVNLDNAGIWDDQIELMTRMSEAMAGDEKQFVRHFGREATLGNSDLLKESVSLWK